MSLIGPKEPGGGGRPRSVQERLIAVVHRMTGHMALPLHLEPLRGRCLLHVSDTPTSFYGDLARLVAFLRPRALIHTGDLADDVKLELHPQEIDRYRHRLAALFRHLPPFEEGLFIACGNHDRPEAIAEAAPTATVIEGGGVVRLGGLELALAHHFAQLPLPPRPFNLFGHAPSPTGLGREGIVYLNGLEALAVIAVAGGKVHRLPYPSYVDNSRCNRRKIGL